MAGDLGRPVFPLDLLDSVGIYLPAAIVVRLRTSCTRWRDLSSTPAFLLAHHRRQVPKPLVLFLRDLEELAPGQEGYHRFNVRLDTIDVTARSSRPVIQFGETLPASIDPAERLLPNLLQIEGSCDGVVLASYDGALYAYNPLTRFWARLPPPHGYTGGGIVGFYTYQAPAAEEEAELRVLYHAGGPEETKYWVYTLGGGDDRCIDRPSEKADMDPLLASGVSGACQNPPALVNDCLHWIPHKNLGNQLVVFDTRVEMFRWMNAPAVPDPRKGSSSSQLAHMDSKLIFASINTTGVEVWSVACYASAEWVWLYQLQLPLSEIDHFRGDETPTVQVLPLERQVLVQCTHNILLCDNTGVLKNFELPGHRVVMLPHVLKESLLQRSFLHLQEKDAAYLDPPFFHPLWD